MLRILRRLFASAAPPATNTSELGFEGGGFRSWLKRRGVVIENLNREPPVEGLIQVQSTEMIASIFKRDAARQEAEYIASAMQQRVRGNPTGGPPNGGIGTIAGISCISFNKPRNK